MFFGQSIAFDNQKMFRLNCNYLYELSGNQNLYLLIQSFSTYSVYFAATYYTHIMSTLPFLGKKSLTLQ